MKRHLISAADLSRGDAVLILDTAEELASLADRPIKKLPTLRGRTVVNLFYEDSTRTRISFEAAAKRLSADVINFSAKGSSVAKGESLKDTALTLEAMGADAVIIRHGASGAAHRLAGRDAQLVRIVVPASYELWVPPGACYNSVGYWHAPGARVVYREHGQERSFGIASLISWRGVWYVVHLGAVQRTVVTGIVYQPAAGPGVPGPPGGC